MVRSNRRFSLQQRQDAHELVAPENSVAVFVKAVLPTERQTIPGTNERRRRVTRCTVQLAHEPNSNTMDGEVTGPRQGERTV